MLAEMNLAGRIRTTAALADPHRLAIVDALALGDRTPHELGALVDAPTNLLAHHLTCARGRRPHRAARFGR